MSHVFNWPIEMSYFADTASCRRQFQCNFFEIYNKTVGEEDEDDSRDDHRVDDADDDDRCFHRTGYKSGSCE